MAWLLQAEAYRSKAMDMLDKKLSEAALQRACPAKTFAKTAAVRKARSPLALAYRPLTLALSPSPFALALSRLLSHSSLLAFHALPRPSMTQIAAFR